MKELDWLYKLNRYGEKGLKYITESMKRLGDPHIKLRVMQITGTNGKGSTAAMTAEVLRRAGKKTGLFTSPHLVKFNERIQVNGQQITDDEIKQLIKEVKSTGLELKFFEFCTAMALLYFARKKVDYAILEAGMGGKNDPTTVCDAEIAAITSIGEDHTHILGKTIEEITKEKTGIIKKNSTVITCNNNAGLKWIKEASKKLITTQSYTGTVGLRGSFQKTNAGIAYEICKQLEIDEEIIQEGIAHVKWPGRMEYLAKNLLVDCAHNLTAIKATAPYVKALPKRKLVVVFGVLADKNYKKMIKALPKPDFLILTKPPIERALDPAKLAYDGPCAIVEEPAEALRFAQNIAREDDLIFVTGSCYLTGKIMEISHKSETYGKETKLSHAQKTAQQSH
ncbi:bifunctional folylpolyglutamate synthase/dihydrofolate synthase [Candidatus Woesearchaeota archaeon]|nr:bifunctional folylpolyglutamate synthase/dihydrofolate synthase [Candidatus Woesearchaeota archaeon]MBW3016617.1 bifunctional folylpolyglutamate synthase/dihydrofolate synthase [Candidatus Woesearchaeota archaeon]